MLTIYVGDIEITFESVAASQTSIKHENEYLIAVEEETRSTSPSPLELQEVDKIKKEEDEEVHLQEPHFIQWSLNMNEKNIQEALSILHDTHALVSNSCLKVSSLEEPSLLEDMEKIQRAMCNIKGNFMSLIFYRKNDIDLSEW